MGNNNLAQLILIYIQCFVQDKADKEEDLSLLFIRQKYDIYNNKKLKLITNLATYFFKSSVLI